MTNPIAGVVHKFMEVADVDGVVRQVDVNAVVQRVEWNDVVQRIDWNQVLSTIDWNQQLARIDFDQVLERVDTNSILVRSSAGMFTNFLDTLRTQLVLMDLYLWILARCRMRGRRLFLPPSPGSRRQRHDRKVYPKGRSNKAVAVQGRYCGFVSKAMAILIDIVAITILFALLFRVIEWLMTVFTKTSFDEASQKTKQFQQDQENGLMVVLYCIYWFLYFFLCEAIAGQTLGMMAVGLKVCNCARTDPYSSVSLKQAFIRTCLLPITVTLLPPLGLIGLFRRDGRMLHDLVAHSGIIYLWDAELAKLRHKALRDVDRTDSMVSEGDEDISDALDDMMGEEIEEDDDECENLLPPKEDDRVNRKEPRNYSAVV